MSGSRKRWLLAAAVVSIILVVSSAGLMGVAAVESPDGERTINDTALDPGETTEVEVHVTDVDQDWLAIYEDVDSDLEATITDFDPVPLVDRQLDDTDAVVVWEDDEPLGSTTLTYEVTVPEDAEEGDFYTFDGAVDLGGGTETDTTGENVITVGEPDDVLIDITTPEYVDEGKTYEAGVEVFNPTDEEVSGDLVYTVDGEEQSDLSQPSLDVHPGIKYKEKHTLTAPNELAGEAHVAEFNEISDDQGVYFDLPQQRLGDVTGSGEITINDAVAIQFESLGLDPLDQVDTFNPNVADINREGEVTINDAVLAQFASLGLAENGIPNVTKIDAPDQTTTGESITISATVENDGELGISTGAELRFGDTVEDATLVAVDTFEVEGKRGGTNDDTELTIEVDVPDRDPGVYEYGVFVGDDSNTATIEITD